MSMSKCYLAGFFFDFIIYGIFIRLPLHRISYPLREAGKNYRVIEPVKPSPNMIRFFVYFIIEYIDEFIDIIFNFY